MKFTCRPLHFLIVFALALAGCGDAISNDLLNETTPAVQAESITPTRDQADRRARSEAYCKAHDVPFYKNPNALFASSEAETKLRTLDEVVDRAIALYYVSVRSEGVTEAELGWFYKDFGVATKLSTAEKTYVTAKKPSKQQTINANWRYESLHVMLWALGFVDSLGYPDTYCDVASDVELVISRMPAVLRSEARLRSKKEILDAADLILRLDWAVVNARQDGLEPPGGMDKGVVYERHFSLNWLTRYLDQEWDDVSTDT